MSHPYAPYSSPPSVGRPLDPLSRRLLGLAGLLSVLLIAAVVNYLLHDGGEVLNPVAQAAERTAAMPGAQLKMEITYSFEGSSQTVVGTGFGAINTRTGRERAVLHVPRVGGGSMTARSVASTRVVYLTTPELAAQLPAGKGWMAMEPLLGHSSKTAFGSDMAIGRTMKGLETFDGDVEELDHQLVRGRQTTRYKATLEMGQIAQVLNERGEADLGREFEQIAKQEPNPIPIEVWVDEQGRVRLFKMVQQLPSGDGAPAVTMEMRTEYLAFDARPKIKLPAKHRVFDYTPVLRAELGMLDGHSFGASAPPAGAKPLSVAAFRRRVGGICSGAFTDAKGVIPEEREMLGRLKGLDPNQARAGAAKPIVTAIGHWFEADLMPLYRRQFREIAAVPPPAQYGSSYRRYLRLSAIEGERATAEMRVFQLGQTKMPNSAGLKAEEKKQKTEREALARSLGISVCEKELPKSEGAGQSV